MKRPVPPGFSGDDGHEDGLAAQVCEFTPSTVADVAQACRQLSEVAMSPELVAEVHRLSGGRMREVLSRQCLPGVFTYAVDPKQKVHLTAKPVRLVKDLLAVSPEGSTVLDPFLGGGTTAMACLETGRRFIGVELSTEYAALAAARIRAAEEALKN